MYDYLKKLYGEHPEEGLTYEQLEAALDAAKDTVKLANLKEGGYVAKDKFEAANTELAGVKQQLMDANTQIQGFKGKEKDAEAIAQQVSEWENKYNADTQALKNQLETQAREHAEDMFFSGYQFTSKAARRGVLDDFRAQKFTLENGEFKGGKAYMDSLMKQDDYKGAFKQPEEPKLEKKQPRFAGPTSGTAQINDNPFNFQYSRLRQPKQ